MRRVFGPQTPSRRAHLGAQPERGALLGFPSAGRVTVLYCLAGRLRSGGFYNSSVGEGRGRRKRNDPPLPTPLSNQLYPPEISRGGFSYADLIW